MKTYTMTLHCDICGCEGEGSLNTVAAAWDSTNTIRHKDPTVCAENLKRKKLELDKKKKELEARLAELNKQ